MRAPPEAVTISRGRRRSVASSAARATFSPTTDPIEPPMKKKSMTTRETSMPPMEAVPRTAASRSPVIFRAAAARSGYGLESVKTIGSRETRLASSSLKEPSSTSWVIRSRAGTRKWCPHDVQTRWPFSRLFLKRSSEHPGQRSHRSGSLPGVALRRVNGFLKLGTDPPH